jgi:hypothetical protein
METAFQENTTFDTVHSSFIPENALTRNTLNALFRCMIPYIRISNFASPEECETLTQEASQEGFSAYRGVEPKINRIGNTVFEYERISSQDYFDDAERANKVQSKIFKNSFNPIERLADAIELAYGIRPEIAQTQTGESYYAGLIRRIEESTLIHVDFAPAEQSEWEVCDVICQLSWNLYLRTSNINEGHTKIYNKQWETGHQKYKEGIYGYNAQIIEDCESASFKPIVGDLVLFNTRNYHEVAATQGERVTVTSALGLLPDGRLVLWS